VRTEPLTRGASGVAAAVGGGQTGRVEITAEVELDAAPERVRALIADLDQYPQWLSIVAKADPVTAAAGRDTWAVELRAKVGPLARSKRLRMVRTIDEVEHLRFERAEDDGREHAQWTLDAHLLSTGSGTHLRMVLQYSGGFGGGIVERLLAEEIDRSRMRLRAMLEADSPSS
jgi:uncharacterized protein YndB with AHSA1/START domain